MPTTVTYEVGSGKTYANLTNALAQAAIDYPDLVASDVVLRFVVYPGATEETATTDSTLDPFTTSATNRIEILADSASRHAGDPNDTNVARLFGSRNYLAVFNTAQKAVLIDGLFIENTAIYGGYGASPRTNGTIQNCIIKGQRGATHSGGWLNSNLIISTGATLNGVEIPIFHRDPNRGDQFHNNTVISVNNSTAVGISVNDLANVTSSLSIKNNASFGFATAYSEGATNKPVVVDNNASDGTAFGTNHVAITSADFVDAANDDYTPAPGGALEKAGTNAGTAGEANTDIAGRTRVYWDIGAYAADASAADTITRKDTVTIAAANVDETAVNFPVYLDLAEMPAEFWTAINAGDGTADSLRVFQGDIEMPREIVSCDPVAETGEVHFLADTVAAQDCVVTLYADGSSADYAVDATYGRNNVWADYGFVHHLRDGSLIENSTGDSAYDVTANGGGVSSAVSGPFGSAADFDGTTNAVLDFGTSFPKEGTSDSGSLSVWASVDALLSQEQPFVSYGVTVNDQTALFADNQNTLGNNVDTYVFQMDAIATRPDTLDNTMVAGSWALLHGRYDAINTDVNAALNGAETASIAVAASWYTGSSSEARYGAAGGYANHPLDGKVAEGRFANFAFSDNWISQEYANQSDPASFYSIVANDAGGATVQLKRWNGSSWENFTARVYTGSAWIPVKIWDGSAWLDQA